MCRGMVLREEIAMGWSCRADAAKVMDIWTAWCVSETGSSNTYPYGGRFYFHEISRKEHADGAITGSILVIKDAAGTPVTAYDKDAPLFAKKSGSFKISGDGEFVRGPA